MDKAIFAGTFDPFTLGHYDIVSRSACLFKDVVVGVANVASGRKDRLETEKRVAIAEACVNGLKNVTVKSFDGFLADFARREDATVLVRGIRTANDFEYEKALCEVYKQQNPKLECLYMISSHQYNHISGSIVRDLALLNGDFSAYVCKDARELIQKFYKAK